MCGIFGIVNQRPKAFDYQTFCTLGVANDERGGDSCGIFIDGSVEYGVDINRTFENFMIPTQGGSQLLENVKKSLIALGHCRKASVGKISVETAQPVVLYDENNQPIFVVIHNGTIYNYKELANKYIPEIDITGLTDSQVMTRIFFYKGYDVLKEYVGSATFVIVDYRTETPTVLMWRAESKTSKHSTTVSEERPLYLSVGKHDLVFSSIGKYLPALRPYSYFCVPKANCLIQYIGNKLTIIEKYDRSECTQTEPKTSAYVYTNAYTPSSLPMSTSKKSTAFNGWVSQDVLTLQFKVDNTVLHGQHPINSYGHLNDDLIDNTDYHHMYFWNGVLLKNKQCYEFLLDLAEEVDATPQDIYESFKELVIYLSPYPFYLENHTMYFISSSLTKEIFTGFMPVPFGPNLKEYDEGKFTGSHSKTCLYTLESYLEHVTEVIDFNNFLNVL